MDSQELFAKRLTARLDEGLDDLPQHIKVRLDLARENAMAQAKRHRAVSVGGGLLALNWQFARNRLALAAMATMILLAGALAQYNHIQDVADEAADLDATILSDEAPVQSYMDPGFSSVFHSGLLKRNDDGK